MSRRFLPLLCAGVFALAGLAHGGRRASRQAAGRAATALKKKPADEATKAKPGKGEPAKPPEKKEPPKAEDKEPEAEQPEIDEKEVLAHVTKHAGRGGRGWRSGRSTKAPARRRTTSSRTSTG